MKQTKNNEVRVLTMTNTWHYFYYYNSRNVYFFPVGRTVVVSKDKFITTVDARNHFYSAGKKYVWGMGMS